MLIPIGFLAASGGVEAPFEWITTTTLGADAASVTFDVSAYASTYKHLQIRGYARSAKSADATQLGLRLNGVTTANQSAHYIRGQLSDNTVRSGAFANQTFMEIANVAGNSVPATIYSPFVLDIMDAFSSTKGKTIRGLSGSLYNYPPSSFFGLTSGASPATASISTLTLLSDGGSFNLKAGSRFSIYGVRG